MLLDEAVPQVIAEMKEALKETSNRSEGVKEINYYLNNRDRMRYKEYKDKGYPNHRAGHLQHEKSSGVADYRIPTRSFSRFFK